MINEREVYKWFDIMKDNNQLTEIRIIGNNQTFSGYFKDVKTLVEAIKPYSSYNIYFTINRIDETCYGREQCNRIVKKPKNTTSDSEIIARDYVFLDLDAKKISGVNATEEEVNKTKAKAKEVYNFLKKNGFFEPITIFSGNGVHFYLRCALLPTEENNKIIKRFTQAMGMLFSDEYVDIDQKIYNLGRIAKVPGTYSRKGSSDNQDRPQRLCYVVKSPTDVKVNDIEYFKKIADLYPEEEQPKPSAFNNYSTEKFNLDDFIAKYNIPVTSKVQVSDGTKYYLEHCLFNPQHRGKDAILFQHNNGAVAYFCYHNSCSGNDWRKVREMYEPNAYVKKTSDFYSDRQNRFRKVFTPIIQTEEQGEVWLKMSQISKPKFDLGNYIPSGVKQIDDLIIGFKRKHVTVWSGNRGCAKTTFLNMLILNGANMGYKSALWTGELDADEEKIWLYLQAAGKEYNKTTKKGFYYTPDIVCDKIDEWIDRYFWIFNNLYKNNFKQIVDKIKELKEKEDIDFVILDNLMTLDINDLDGDKNDKQKDLMYTLTCLAKELNIHIHIVCHPNKSGNFLRPNNISGTGHIPDLAQNVFILHRVGLDFSTNAKDFLSNKTLKEIEDSRCTNVIEICKCRDKGSAIDNFIKLYFEIESNRLKNSIAEHIIYGWEEQYEQGEISYIQPNTSFTPQPVKIEEPTPPPFRTNDFSSYIPKEYIEPAIPNDYDDDCPF